MHTEEMNAAWKWRFEDTIRTTACLISRGSTNPEEYRKLMEGIKSIRTHRYKENYSGEHAAIQACSAMYMAACLLKGKKFPNEGFLPFFMNKERGRHSMTEQLVVL